MVRSLPGTAQEDDAFNKFTIAAAHLVLKTCTESFLAKIFRHYQDDSPKRLFISKSQAQNG